MKKIISIIITLSMLSAMLPAVNADSGITVVVDGEKVEFEAPPIIENDRVLVPMRDVFEKMGAKVYWFDEEKKALASTGIIRVNFVIGSPLMIKTDYSIDYVYGNDTAIDLDVPAQIIGNRTYVPLRAISEAFDYTVTWDDTLRVVSVQSSSAPTDKNEITALLLKYNIISEEDVDKDLYITNLEALKSISRVKNGGKYTSDLRRWYRGDTLAPLDYLDDETKGMLLSISDGRGVIKTAELADIDINSNLTEYQAIVYLTRMTGSTYGCTETPIELISADASDIYEKAASNGLIDTSDMTNADKAITRDDFYALLAKAIYMPFMSGGAGGVDRYTYIEILENRAERIASATPQPEEKEAVKIDTNAEFDDNMSLSWTVDEKYNDCGTQILYITAEGEIENFIYGAFADSLDTDEIIDMIAYNGWNVPKAIRCEYSDDNNKVYVDIDLSDIEVIKEDYTIIPGTYTPFEGQWVPEYITLNGGCSFKKGAYYALISYNHDYRLEKYNNIRRMIIKSEEDTDTFSNLEHNTFKCGGIDFDDMHIREITVEGSAKKGFKMRVSEESKEIFEINKK